MEGPVQLMTSVLACMSCINFYGSNAVKLCSYITFHSSNFVTLISIPLPTLDMTIVCHVIVKTGIWQRIPCSFSIGFKAIKQTKWMEPLPFSHLKLLTPMLMSIACRLWKLLFHSHDKGSRQLYQPFKMGEA